MSYHVSLQPTQQININCMNAKSILLLLLSFNLVFNSNLFAQYSVEDQKEIDGYNKIIKSPLKSKAEKANAYDGLGNIYRTNFDYQKSIQAHQQSLDYFVTSGDKYSEAWCYKYLGNTYQANKSYKTALEYFQLSYKLFLQENYKEEAATMLNVIGFVYYLQVNYIKAEEYYLKSYELSKKINYEDGILNAYGSLGYLFQSTGNLPKALEYYEHVLKFSIEISNEYATAQILISIGWVYYEQGNYYQVVEHGKESLALFSNMYENLGMASALNLIGVGYYELEVYDKALEFLKRALTKSKEVGDTSGKAAAYHNMAAVYFKQRNFTEALKYFELGLEINQEVGDKYNMTIQTCDVGTANFNLDRYDKANEYALRGEKMALAFGSPRLIRLSKKLLFNLSVKQGEMEKAEKYVLEMMQENDRSIDINFPTLSENEKEKFFENVSEDYMEFNDFVLKRGVDNPSLRATVFNNTLKHKGLLLKSSTAMRHAIHESKDTSLIKQYESWILLKTEISKAYTAGESTIELEEKANILEKSLVKNSQAFSDFDKIQNLTWLDVQKNLKEGEAAIEFIHFNEFDDYGNKEKTVLYCALIVTPTSVYPEMVQLFHETQLEKLLGSFGGNNLNYINGIYGTESTVNTTLYDLVWKPLEAHLLNTKTVYISPTGLLHRVAFAAMAKEKSVLLCDSYNIKLQSSTGKVAVPEEFILGKDWQITLFGGIDYDTDSSTTKIWSFLEGTKVEVENISNIFTAGNFKVAQSKTEEGFKENASSSDIIHMSTHGFFYPDPEKLTTSFEVDTVESDDLVFRGTSSSFGVKNFVFNKNPLMRSGLVLSGANRVWNNPDMHGKEDGVLTAYEVAQIDLRHTGLVVLSACETGLGDINGSEGVYGLQRSFKMAGVKYIVMSLWQVPDKETQEFMTLFYKNLLLIKEPKEAFVQTQFAMRKKYDPYYWAAFVLIE